MTAPAPVSGLLPAFEAPALLLAGLAAAALSALLLSAAARAAVRRRDAIVSPALSARSSGLPSRARGIGLRVLVALVALALGAALARPRWGERTETVERRGADVVLLLDTSASMRATDVTPSRFVVARQAALSLLSNLPADRVALVGCEGEAQTLVPLTMDGAAVGIFLEALEPGIGAKPGTSIASGLAAASDLLPAGALGGKHCVVFSDGEDLEGGVEKAAERAKAEGIVVHTVFVGGLDGKGAPVPETDVAGQLTGYKTDASGAPVVSKPDPVLLRQLAATTGGTFSVAAPGRTDLSAVARQIDLSARRPLSATLATNLEERFQVPLGVAVASLALLLLGLPRARRTVRAGAASLLAVALAGAASGQEPSPSPPPAPSPTPLPRLERLLGSPRGEAKLGRKAMEEKRYSEAAGHFRRQTDLSPKDPIGPYNLGSALSRDGKAEEAIASLETARTSGRADLAADAAYNAGETFYRAGDYGKAAAAFRDALKRRPGDPDASFNYELCARKAEEEEKKKEQQKPDREPQKKDEKKNKDRKSGEGASPTPTPSPQGNSAEREKKKQEQRERDFESKAKMSREKAEQLLAAIQSADLEEQRRKIAEQKRKRRVGRDW
ncbi:MAG TPA: VWA domain-containing protein [Thermoanaerobaculia bacterium]|nr:VWA domain-containing protein [Thermoanaerobaculia bacterium]